MHIFEFSFFWFTLAPSWYWLMYALWFFICFEYIKRYSKILPKDQDSLLFSLFIWVILGGRIGYVILYSLPYFLDHPLEIFAVWHGGMSFHGGAIGVILAMILFARKKHYQIFTVSDPIVTILPVALWLGRIGNYINKELLWFTGYYWPLAVDVNGISYFPSPLLEALLEWILLCTIMILWRNYESKNGHYPWYASAIFLSGYATFRLISEFFRLPDRHIWYILGTDWMTLGMIYTLPMFLWSLTIFMISRRKT